MNFLSRIKELKREAKKVKFRDLPKWVIALPLLPIIPLPVLLDFINAIIYKAKNHVDFQFETFFAGSFSILIILIIVCIYFGINELKEDKKRLSEKDINDFILSFPEEYRETVIKSMSKSVGKKNYISVKDLNDLEKMLTFEYFKSDIINQEITDALSKNNIIKINNNSESKVKKEHELY